MNTIEAPIPTLATLFKENEELRAQVARLSTTISRQWSVYKAEVDRLCAQIEMLRKAADADGFHRVLAARDAEIETLKAELATVIERTGYHLLRPKP